MFCYQQIMIIYRQTTKQILIDEKKIKKRGAGQDTYFELYPLNQTTVINYIFMSLKKKTLSEWKINNKFFLPKFALYVIKKWLNCIHKYFRITMQTFERNWFTFQMNALWNRLPLYYIPMNDEWIWIASSQIMYHRWSTQAAILN